MAKNIKKRSASHIYFGVNKLTGELKHISEVPSGQKCNCICAACLQPFEARKGTRRRHHFAHVSNYECMNNTWRVQNTYILSDEGIPLITYGRIFIQSKKGGAK